MRLCAVAAVVCLLVGAGVQSVAASSESTVTTEDSALVTFAGGSDSEQNDDSPLALGISPKRALVSLAFLGAVAARKHREPSG
ncbi:hypothetical protein [Halobacterium noricense]|uniref:hypothetical protein n=1 Tax=Halobacterium noricense TaxID=223182 RepID=UPI001E53E283|nr:hypothetical protein [Halobacterium noricense]UHH25355.1 hypothetical protein LT974_00025 [Halobacterium noricense]